MLVYQQHDHFRNRSQIAGLFGACMSPQNRVDVAAGPLCRPKSDSAPSELCCSLQRSTTLSYPHPCCILLDALDENMASYCRDNHLSDVCKGPCTHVLLPSRDRHGIVREVRQVSITAENYTFLCEIVTQSSGVFLGALLHYRMCSLSAFESSPQKTFYFFLARYN